MERYSAALPDWLWSLSLFGLVVLVAIVLHGLAYRVLKRASERTATTTDNIAVRRLRAPSRWLLVAFALSAAQPALALNEAALAAWSRSTIYQRMSEGRFPKSRSLGPKCAVWVESEIDAWISDVASHQ